MKKILILFAITVIGFSGCKKFDDSALWNSINGIDKRVEQLEELCNKMNTNISSLQAIITALETNDYISNVINLTNDEGYVILFGSGKSITIYNGKNGTDGKDGHSPVISVKQDVDGMYYWTLDGEWLKDDSSNNIKVQGIDGITPLLKIENGRWFLSMDNGKNWDDLGKATGADGTNGKDGKDGDSILVTEDENYVYLQLIDDTKITIPKGDISKFGISFSTTDITIINGGESQTITYTITGATEDTIIKTIEKDGWKSIVNPISIDKGTITVTAPDPFVESEILVFANDGSFHTVLETLNCSQTIEFKDPNFLKALLVVQEMNLHNSEKYLIDIDKNKDGKISVCEAKNVRGINLWDYNNPYNISDISEIMYFTDLESLQCSENKLTTIDLSKNVKLIELWCSENQLTALDVSNNTELKCLECSYNQLTALDISKNTRLNCLQCIDNQLTALDVSNNAELEYLECFYNQLYSLDISNNTELIRLNCSFNQLTALDVSTNMKLEDLLCGNNQLNSLDISNNAELKQLSCINNLSITSLDLSNQTKLEYLNCTCMKLSSLDISKNSNLTTLECAYNQITSLDISNNIELELLRCEDNFITSLDVSKHTALYDLQCFGNNISSLDINNLSKLKNLDCSNNPLCSINVSNNPLLKRFICRENNLTTLDVSKNTKLTQFQCENNPLTKLTLYKNNVIKQEYLQKIQSEYGESIIEYTE